MPTSKVAELAIKGMNLNRQGQRAALRHGSWYIGDLHREVRDELVKLAAKLPIDCLLPGIEVVSIARETIPVCSYIDLGQREGAESIDRCVAAGA